PGCCRIPAHLRIAPPLATRRSYPPDPAQLDADHAGGRRHAPGPARRLLSGAALTSGSRSPGVLVRFHFFLGTVLRRAAPDQRGRGADRVSPLPIESVTQWDLRL